jgi:deazaflavin-dependent oxidoreductase (nitroreductase family)
MFSKRTPSDFAMNALSLRTEEMRLEGARILDLTESNPTRAGFLAPPELLGLLGNTISAHYRPDPRGLRSAREAVSRDYAARGVSMDPDHIVLTASSSESCSLLFKLLANPGDEVLVPAMTFIATSNVVEHVGAKSGQQRETALVYGTDGATILLVASKAGAPTNPAWYHNLKANPECGIIAKGRSGRYVARELDGADRESAWAIVTDIYRGYDDYQARSGGRVIPVLALEPVAA